ncbi:MarR family winged helix-turn-helix transcriptional regulator [Chloroflexota bacterium]
MEETISTDQEFNLWILLAETRHTMFKVRKKELAFSGILPRQAHVLRIIHEFGDKVTLKEISKHISREVHSISEQTSRMEKKGLLKKNRELPGTTFTRFEITEKGLEALDLVIKRASIHTIISVLSEEERQQLRLCLEKLLSKAKEIS